MTYRLLLGVLSLTGCADATTTTSGVRLADSLVLEAMIDGRPWVADSGTRSLFVSTRAGRIRFQGGRRGSGDTMETLTAAAGRFAFGTPIPISATERGSNALFGVSAPAGDLLLFLIDSGSAGSLILDGLDPINRLASGRFEFRARILIPSPGGTRLGDSTIHVTAGRFRLPFTGDEPIP